MKTVNLSRKNATLRQVLDLARRDTVLLKDKSGAAFVVSSSDDFDTEVELLRKHHRFQTFLGKRFKSRKRISLDEVEAGLKKTRLG